MRRSRIRFNARSRLVLAAAHKLPRWAGKSARLTREALEREPGPAGRNNDESLPRSPVGLTWRLGEIHVLQPVPFEDINLVLKRAEKVFPDFWQHGEERSGPVLDSLFGGGSTHLGTFVPRGRGRWAMAGPTAKRDLPQPVDYISVDMEGLLPSVALLHMTAPVSEEGAIWYQRLLDFPYPAHHYTPLWSPWKVWRTKGTIPAQRVMQQKVDDSMAALEEQIRGTVAAGLGRKRRRPFGQKRRGMGRPCSIEVYEASADMDSGSFATVVTDAWVWLDTIGLSWIYTYSRGGDTVFPYADGRAAMGLVLFTPTADLPTDPKSADASNGRHFRVGGNIEELTGPWMGYRFAVELGDVADGLRDQVYRSMISKRWPRGRLLGSHLRRYRQLFNTLVLLDRFRLEWDGATRGLRRDFTRLETFVGAGALGGSAEPLGTALEGGVEFRVRVIEQNLNLLARWYDRFVDVAGIGSARMLQIWVIILTLLVIGVSAVTLVILL